LEFSGAQISWRKVADRGASFGKPMAGQETFDADLVGVRIILRHWRAGDRFQPIGMAVAVKLQDWFTNRKIARERRRELIVATTARGKIFWVEGERIGEQYKLTTATRRRLIWRWKRGKTT
jgi:tRNA(Ile)-lysidine synthase